MNYELMNNRRIITPYEKVLIVRWLRRSINLENKNCAFCNKNTNLCIHHKDGNIFNNYMDNLEFVCLSCHTRYHRQRHDTGSLSKLSKITILYIKNSNIPVRSLLKLIKISRGYFYCIRNKIKNPKIVKASIYDKLSNYIKYNL